MKRKLIKAALLGALTVAVSLSACGKKEGSNPVAASPEADSQQAQDAGKAAERTPPAPDTSARPESPELPLLRDTYLGNNVILVYPHPGNWGYISIKGEDAKAMFHALGVKETRSEENFVWLSAKVRQGYDVSCYEQALKASPGNPEYACSLYLNYRSGAVTRQATRILADPSVPLPARIHLGSNVTLVAPDRADHFGLLRIRGEDARTLYQALSIKPVPTEENATWLPASEKRGRNLLCLEMARRATPEAKEYDCTLYFGYRTGKATRLSPNPGT